MNTVVLVMERLGLAPPPPPKPPPAFLEERTPAQVLRPMLRQLVQGAWVDMPVIGPVRYGEAYYDVHLGLDPAKLRPSYELVKANMKRMRRDALQIRNARKAVDYPIFRLAP